MLYSFAVFFISLALVIPKLLPEKLDLYTDMEKDKSEDSTEISDTEELRVVSLKSMLKDPNYVLAALAGCLGYFQYDYLGPILAIRLADL